MMSSPRQEQSIPHLEDLSFRGSAEATLGVELELQILDPETGDLVPGALPILDTCEDEQIEGVAGEFLLCMMEVKTGICASVTEVRDTLAPLLGRVHRVARTLGYELAVGGTHPFNRDSAAAIFPDARYRRIQKAQGWLAGQEAIFGMHVHVGVPDGDRAIGLVNLLTPYLPHLLALSANSPFWQGLDTNFASVRSRLFRPSPTAGIPQHFAGWRDFCDYLTVLNEAGVLEGTKDLYWDLRPRPQLGTIEFRIFDAPASLDVLLGLAALARCLVLDGLRLLEEQPRLLRGDPREFWLAQENRWLASRYGLEATCARAPAVGRTTLAEDVVFLLERLRPVACEHGEDGFLDVFRSADGFASGAARLRRVYRQTTDWRSVLDEMQRGWTAAWSEGLVAPSAETAAPQPSPVSWPGGQSAGTVVPRDNGWHRRTAPPADPAVRQVIAGI